MPLFEYEARSIPGGKLKGRLDAVDEEAVISILRNKGYYPVRIRSYKRTSNINLGDLKKVTIKDIYIFCRQFSVIISAGINIIHALEILEEQTENPKLRKILAEVSEDVRKGRSLSNAMKKNSSFPGMMVNMVEVGETSGTLDIVMQRMAAYYEKEYKLDQKIKQAMTYPAIICIFAILVVMVLVTKVLPVFTGMMTQLGSSQLPLPTRIVMGLSYNMQHRWLLILIIIVMIILGLKSAGRTESGSILFDKIKLNMPVFGKVNRKIITSKFARTFGILMGSGVPLMESISICSNVVENEIIKRVLNSAMDELKRGAGIGDTLASKDIFPEMLTQMIKIGEESGSLDQVLEKTAEFYDGEVDSAAQQLTTMIEPLIIILLAVVVGFIIISIILPIFNMYNTMSM